jgi:gliding motility-associated-like protein
MKRNIHFLILMNMFSSLAAQYSVSGGSGSPIVVNTSQNGLKVYLLNGLSGARIIYTSSDTETHQWYRYSERASNAVPVSAVQNGNTSFINDVQDGYGYFVGLPTDPQTTYVWIVDYSKYIPRFFNLEPKEDEFACMRLRIWADVEAEPLYYYLPSSGYRTTLDRIYHLQYSTQEWDENNRQFIVKEENKKLTDWISEIDIDPPPLSDTHFTLTGDQFAEKFGIQQAIRSDLYRAIAVEAHGIAETNKLHADNERHSEGDALGGSAPIEYTFSAYANEPVAASYKWEISQWDNNAGKMTTIVRYTADNILRYNFEKNGIFQVDLEVRDSRSICRDTIQPFKVMIDSTVVKIPNAFSPGSSIGVNDELRVSFSSITSFKASVFNSQGNLLFQWSDPAKGWDGRVNGKFVPTGVYYVIVEYKDSFGKAKSVSKAVNILRAINK